MGNSHAPTARIGGVRSCTWNDDCNQNFVKEAILEILLELKLKSMVNLKIRTTADLENLALKKGWLTQPTQKYKTLLPKIPFYSTKGHKIVLEEEQVFTKSPCTINIKEPVIVAGNNFGLIYKNYFFPFGYSHSTNWIGDYYKFTSRDSVEVPISPSTLLDMTGHAASLLGSTNHWGHFFVDAMDRLEALVQTNKKILISDKSFFGFNGEVDKNGIVPQSTEIIEALGYPIPFGNLVSVSANNYYLFDDLEAIGLLSEKPALSVETFIKVRQRLLESFSTYDLLKTPANHFLYVGRYGQQKRVVVDEKNLETYVESAGGEVVKLGDDLLHKVIGTFLSSSKIIMVIGSAKFNLLFCKPGTKVMCVVPFGYKTGVLTMLRHICLAFELDLQVYEVPLIPHGPTLLNSDLIISPTDLDNMLSILN